MLTFASDAHRRHHPAPAVPRPGPHDRSARGTRTRRAHPRRDRRRRASARSVAPAAHGLEPVLRVHTADYVEFLEHVHARWRAGDRRARATARRCRTRAPIRGQPLDAPAPPDRGARLVLARQRRDPRRHLGRGDRRGRRDAERAGSAVADGDAPRRVRARATARAITRPPTRTRATASSTTRRSRRAAWAERGARVAILDVDYHHGNGTQQIFYDRGDVCFVSLHADPAHEYPFFSGFAAERGAGAGEGTTHNFPLPARHRVGHVRPGARRPRRARSRDFGARRARRVARRRHRGRGLRHVPARRRRLHAHRRRDRRARAPDACSCRKAATTSA